MESGRSGEEQGRTGGGGWLPPEPPGPRPSVGPPGPDAGGEPGPQGPPDSGEGGSPGAPQPAAQPPHPPPPAYGPPGYGQGSYGAPGWHGPGVPEPGNAEAIVALVLGITSLTLLVFSLGLSSIVSLGCAIAAIPVGRKGRRKVDLGETRKHRGLAQAGFVMGIVGVVLSVLATVFWVLIFVLAGEFTTEFEFESTTSLVLPSAVGSAARGFFT